MKVRLDLLNEGKVNYINYLINPPTI